MPASQKVAEAYVDLVARTASFKAALDDATAQTRKFSAQMRAEMNDARGSIRLVSEELGVGMPRALQSFVARLPGVATAMSAAFNAVAILALVDIVIKAGDKIYEFAQKSEQAAQKHAEAWKSVNAPLMESNDALQVTNDKLANSIAKLEHKPQNGIKLAIDEAVESADKLSSKLDADLVKIQDTVKGQSTGFVQQLFGQASTQDIQDRYQSLQQRIAEVNAAGNANIRSARSNGGDVDAATKALNASLSPLFAEGIQFYSDVLRGVNAARAAQANGTAVGFNTQNMDARGLAASGLLNFFSGQQDALGLNQTNDALTKKNNALEAQQEAVEQSKQASAKLLAQIQTNYDDRNRLNKMSLAQDAAFWDSRIVLFNSKSAEYREVVSKANAAESALQKLFSTTMREENARSGAAPGLASDKGQDQYDAAITKSAEQQAALSAALDEMRTHMDLATGAIGPHDAALNMASAHAGDYAAKLTALNVQLQKLKDVEFDDAQGKNLDPENATKQLNIQNQIADLTGKAQLQKITDAQAVLSTTWTGMIDSVFDELVRKSQDTQNQLKQIAASTIDSLNTEMAKSLTGQKTDYSKVFEASAQSLAKSGLQQAEGGILKAFGLGGGKRDGSSAANALFVVQANGAAAGVVPGLSSGILGLFGGSKGSVSGTGGAASSGAAGSGFGNVVGSFLGHLFGGGHALGGDVMAGVPIDVGELGKERFVPSVPGRIVPHNQLGNGGPSIGYVDARGTDPVQTYAAVHRAMTITHAQSVRDAGHAMQERQKRLPR